MKFDDAYYQSLDWFEKREKRWILDSFECRMCSCTDKDKLTVHHKPSSYRKRPQDVSVEDDLITLCWRCHDLITSVVRADRYKKKPLLSAIPHKVEVPVLEERIHEEVKIEVGRCHSADVAQWAIERSNGLLLQEIEGDFREAKEDGR